MIFSNIFLLMKAMKLILKLFGEMFSDVTQYNSRLNYLTQKDYSDLI